MNRTRGRYPKWDGTIQMIQDLYESIRSGDTGKDSVYGKMVGLLRNKKCLEHPEFSKVQELKSRYKIVYDDAPEWLCEDVRQGY